MSSAARVPQLPDVPTVAEAGYPGYKVLTWNGLLASAATPKPIIEKIAGELAKACKDTKFVERLATLGADPSCVTPAEFAELVAADLKQWSEVVATAGIRQK